MGSQSTFAGTAEDYLNWFKIGYAEENKVILPPSQTFGRGLPREESKPETKPPLQIYQNYDLGSKYADKYREEHVEEFKNRGQEQPTSSHAEKGELDAIEEDTVDGTVADIEDVQDEKAQVYLHYDFSKYNKEATSLPIFNYRKEILDKIAAYKVVVIEGQTGCGKSTQVPQYILDEAVSENRHVNIIVTQPRKIAAMSLAARVCKERGWHLGSIVGYQIGLDNKTTVDTRIAYVTTEVLIQKMIHKHSLDNYTHVILDEVHERDEHTDFALLVVKKLINTVSRNIKVILMSATIDASKFAHYFSTPVSSHLIPAPIVSVEEPSIHRVDIYYLDNLLPVCKMGKAPHVDHSNPEISKDMLELAVEMIKKFDNYERGLEGIASPVSLPTKRHAVLMFVPGWREIEITINALKQEAPRCKWVTSPLHSTITVEEQQTAFIPPPPGFRKIIVATNIAESSITVSDIKFVIDFCLTKVLMCDRLTNYTSLQIAWASQSSCQQRAGRAGRVSSGRVYRLVPQRFYSSLPAYTTPELCRIPLSQVVLKAKLLDMGEPQALLALALDPPNIANIHRTVLSLKQIGALSMYANGQVVALNGDLTFFGRVAASLPLDPLLSKLMLMGYLFGCLRETVIIAASLSLKSFHSRPFQDEVNAYMTKLSWSYGSFCDCMAALNTYNLWENMKNRGAFHPPASRKECNWAEQNYVQISVLKDVHHLVQELNERLVRLNITTENYQNPPVDNQQLILKICISAAFFPNYFKRAVPQDFEESIGRDLHGHDPFSTVAVNGLPSNANILYDQQIRKMFRDVSQDLKIFYNSTYAEKEHELMQAFSEEASDSLGSHTLAGYMKKPTRQTTTLCRDGELLPAELPSPSEITLSVHVAHVEDAGHFWAISNDNKSFEHLEFIQSTITFAAQSGKLLPLRGEELVPGKAVIAPYMTGGSLMFFRAEIKQVVGRPGAEQRVQVHFVDYGNTEFVSAADLREMPKRLKDANIPMLALECHLSEVKPTSSKHAVEPTWSVAACRWMYEHLIEKDFTLQIYSVVDQILRVQVFEMERHGNMVSMNELLIKKGFAKKAEEFYMSKQNHNLRALYSYEVTDLDEPISSSSLNFASEIDEFSQKKQLRGPNSPLELSFQALSRTGWTKTVRVDTSSVNSVSLEQEPHSPYDRLLVAFFVSLNQSETNINLHNTTLMPPIPGILSLCLLLFCPMAELRVNEDGSEYSGAVVGLGVDPKNGNPLYPEEDIEVAFDIKFTNDDLTLINKVRFLMNSIMEMDHHIPGRVLLSTQKRLRDFIMQLLDAKREAAESDPNSTVVLKKVPEEDIYCPVAEGVISTTEKQMFPLHNGVYLKEPTESKSAKTYWELDLWKVG